MMYKKEIKANTLLSDLWATLYIIITQKKNEKNLSELQGRNNIVVLDIH